jgi:hypothetical protein
LFLPSLQGRQCDQEHGWLAKTATDHSAAAQLPPAALLLLLLLLMLLLHLMLGC